MIHRVTKKSDSRTPTGSFRGKKKIDSILVIIHYNDGTVSTCNLRYFLRCFYGVDMTSCLLTRTASKLQKPLKYKLIQFQIV